MKRINGNGFWRWLKQRWFLIPFLLATIIAIVSWIKAREMAEIRFGHTLEDVVKTVEEIDKEKDITTRGYHAIDKRVSENTIKIRVVEEDIKEIKTDQKEIGIDVKEILKKM